MPAAQHTAPQSVCDRVLVCALPASISQDQPASHKRESTPHLLASLYAGVAGERSNLRAGQPTAATAHLYLNMAVPQLLGRYLPAYASFTVCSPALYLLANAPGVVGPDSTLEALAKEVAATTARWVHQHSCAARPAT